MTRKTHTLGGRQFVALQQSTIEHDFLLMDSIRAAGLDTVTLLPNEDVDAFAMRLLRAVIESGRIFDLLGATLIPAGTNDLDWTPETSAATAAFIRKLSDPADKVAVQQLVVELLIGFFQDGLVSLMISPKFSPTSPDVQHGSATAAPSTSGTGTTLLGS